jgi:hypothetical protein
MELRMSERERDTRIRPGGAQGRQGREPVPGRVSGAQGYGVGGHGVASRTPGKTAATDALQGGYAGAGSSPLHELESKLEIAERQLAPLKAALSNPNGNAAGRAWSFGGLLDSIAKLFKRAEAEHDDAALALRPRFDKLRSDAQPLINAARASVSSQRIDKVHDPALAANGPLSFTHEPSNSIAVETSTPRDSATKDILSWQPESVVIEKTERASTDNGAAFAQAADRKKNPLTEAVSATAKETANQPAPAPKLDERDFRGPLTAAAYFAWNQVHILESIRRRLGSTNLPGPHARLVWTNPAALAGAFEYALIATSGTGMELAHRLPELLYPSDAFAIIDQHRDLNEGNPSPDVRGKPARGSRDWNPIVGQALAIEVEACLRHSLPRMGLRYVAQADDYHGAVSADMLVASSPLDLVVARLVCDPQLARFVAAKQKGKGRRGAHDTDAKTAFKDGLRLLSLEWMGPRDAKLWNYVRVVDCADATAEEVSNALYERGDGKNHTEYAYGLVLSLPYVRVPAAWARNMPGAKEHAPAKDNDTAEGTSVLDLADSSVADEAARAQAGKPTDKLDMNGLARTLASSEAQLRFIGDQLGDWKLSYLVGPALRRVAKQKEALLATPAETLKSWSSVADAQALILIEATGEIVEVLQVAAGAHIQAGSPEAAPFRDVAELFGIAMGESHLSQTAAAQLAVAKQKKAMLPLLLHERALRENHEVAQQMATEKPAPINTAGPQDPAASAQASNRTLEANLLDMRARALAGDMPSSAELEDASVATTEATINNRLVMLHDRVGKYESAVSGSDEGMAKVVNVALKPLPNPQEVAKAGGQFTADDYQALAAKLRAVQMKAHDIGAQMRRASMPDHLPDDPAQARAAIAAARKKAVADAQAAFAKLADAELEKMLDRAVKLIHDARINQMIVDIALMIGVSVAAGFAGSWVGGLVRGAMLAEVAVDTAAFARTATAARWVGGAANVVTDAGVQAVAQTGMFGGETGLSFAENVMTNIMTLGALRPIHTLAGELGALDDQAKGIYKALSHGRVAFAHAGVFTAEMLVAAGASYVAARMVHGKPKNDEEATAWGLQGASMAVGHFINRRLGSLNERLGKLGEHGAHLLKRGQSQLKLAKKLEDTGSTEHALHLLDEHVRLLRDEQALLNDPTFVKHAGLDPQQLAAMRTGNHGALADTQSQAFGTMQLRFLGLEPISANGLVWSGDRAQIELVLADASGAVRNVRPAGEKSWSADMGGQHVTFVELDHGPEMHGRVPTAAEAEVNRAMARRAIQINAQRSQQVTSMMADRKAPKVKHITVGEGVAGTLSHSTQTHGTGAMPGPLTEMPDAIAISDQPDWWQILGDRDIGQPVGEWRSPGYKRQPGVFNPDHKNLGRASDVAYANAMTALESGMATVRGRVTAVEQFKPGGEPWPIEAKWRVKIDDAKWVYSETAAKCNGLGVPRKLGAINDALEGVLKRGGRISYAQQQLIPSVPEGTTVVVIGDGGTAGWAAQEAVRTGRKAIVIARNGDLSSMPPHLRQYLAEHAIPVFNGEVQTAAIENGRLILGVAQLGSDVVDRTVIGDGVSLAIGQATALPGGMESLRFRMMKRFEHGTERVVALEAYDPKTGDPTGLVVQGAAMTTWTFKSEKSPVHVDNREEFVKALAEQANAPDVPQYSKGVEPSIHQSARNIPLSNERTK